MRSNIIIKFRCVKALEEYSKAAKVFVLIHKMDLVPNSKKQIIFEKRKNEILNLSGNIFNNVICLPTSIWEVTLYKAWTDIVSSLIGNGDVLKSSLEKFASSINADEVMLFEKSTFLLTSHYASKTINDDQRYIYNM